MALYTHEQQFELGHGMDYWPLLERAAQIVKAHLRSNDSFRREGGIVVRSGEIAVDTETLSAARSLVEREDSIDAVELSVDEVNSNHVVHCRVRVRAEHLQAPPDSVTRARQIAIWVGSTNAERGYELVRGLIKELRNLHTLLIAEETREELREALAKEVVVAEDTPPVEPRATYSTRVHRRNQRIGLRDNEDIWSLLVRAERVLAEQLRTFGTGKFISGVRVTDTGGHEQHGAVDAAQQQAIKSRHELRLVTIWATEDHDLQRMVEANADHGGWAHARSRVVKVEASVIGTHPFLEIDVKGPDEAEVAGLAIVLVEELDAERDRGEVSEAVKEPAITGVSAGNIFIAGPAPAQQPLSNHTAPRTSPSRTRVRRFGSALVRVVNHNWTITVVGGVIAAIVGTVVAVVIIGQ